MYLLYGVCACVSATPTCVSPVCDDLFAIQFFHVLHSGVWVYACVVWYVCVHAHWHVFSTCVTFVADHFFNF